MSAIPLLIFAKTPIAGQVKTRLHSHCSPQQAAEIAALLLRGTLEQVSNAWPGRVILVAAPSAQDPAIQDLAEEYEVETASQGEGDLGEKMALAAQTFGFPVAIIGSDSPHISDQVLHQAHTLLQGDEHVLGPSTDGGYYLLGLVHNEPTIFQQIEWGSETVLESTLARADFQLLPPITDIDRWQDLLDNLNQLPELSDYLLTQSLIKAKPHPSE